MSPEYPFSWLTQPPVSIILLTLLILSSSLRSILKTMYDSNNIVIERRSMFFLAHSAEVFC